MGIMKNLIEVLIYEYARTKIRKFMTFIEIILNFKSEKYNPKRPTILRATLFVNNRGAHAQWKSVRLYREFFPIELFIKIINFKFEMLIANAISSILSFWNSFPKYVYGKEKNKFVQ